MRVPETSRRGAAARNGQATHESAQCIRLTIQFKRSARRPHPPTELVPYVRRVRSTTLSTASHSPLVLPSRVDSFEAMGPGSFRFSPSPARGMATAATAATATIPAPIRNGLSIPTC